MADQPMQVVFALLDARRRHDIAAVTELLDPAVVHQGVTEELVCENREEVLHNVRRSFQRDDGDIDHLELVATGDSVIVPGGRWGTCRLDLTRQPVSRRTPRRRAPSR
jgi:hypothetical protein